MISDHKLLHGAYWINIHLPARRIYGLHQRVQIGSTHDHLPTVLAPDALHQRGGGTNHIRIFQAKLFDPAIEALAQEKRLVLAAMTIGVTIRKLDELAKRWIAVAPPRLDLQRVKLVVVVARGRVDTEILRIEGLYNDAPGLGSASGTTRYLCQQRKGALGCREIGHIQGDISRYYSNQRDARQIQPLCDHLRAHQDIRLAIGKAIEELLVRVAVLRGIAVPAQQARMRKAALYGILHLFRSQAEVAYTRTLTGGAELQYWPLLPAVVAEQDALSRMVRQGHIAAVADRHEAAVST